MQPLLAELPAGNVQPGERVPGEREHGEREDSFPCHSPGSESFIAPVAVGYVAQSLAGAASLLLRLFDRRCSVVLASGKAIMEAGEELGELKGSMVELPL